MAELRPGEITLPFDPGAHPDDGVRFIGRIRSGWAKGDCPRNVRQARERGEAARVELDPAYQQGLQGLKAGDHIILIYWMDRGRRDLILQTPKHRGDPIGTFAIRSPMRPNPVALSTVRITAIEGPVIHIDATDVFDNTPVIDIKPWLPSVDIPPQGTA
ncbi:MAG: tRNA (N6-threonylcarbamoyladenosine(37)-N6)-methyltransferase TrmO [Qingshengfaniella sp.]